MKITSGTYTVNAETLEGKNSNPTKFNDPLDPNIELLDLEINDDAQNVKNCI